jgi:acyl-CoA thioesterase
MNGPSDPTDPAALAGFAAALELVDAGDGRFVRPGLDTEGTFVFAGTFAALMLRAAARTVDQGPVEMGAVGMGAVGMEVRSIHSLYLRAARPADDLEVVVTPVHSGRQLGASTVTVGQDGRTCSHAQVLFGPPADDLVRHGTAMPAVAAPEDAPAGGFANLAGELRVVDGVDLQREDQALPPVLSAWRRCPGLPATGIAAEAVLAHDANAFLVGTSLLPHAGFGLAGAHRTITTVITGSDVVFHEPIDLDDWLLLHHESTYAGRGTSFGQGSAFTRAGALVASFTLQAMVRPMAPGHAGAL